MSVIYNKYPTGMSEDEIKSVIEKYQQTIYESRGDINTVMQFAPLITAGQLELHKRLVDKSIQGSETWSKIAIGISIFSALLALVAIGFSYSSYKSDEKWQKEEIKHLEQINQQAEDFRILIQNALAK